MASAAHKKKQLSALPAAFPADSASPAVLIATIAALLSVCFASLLAAHWLYPTDAWTRQFGQPFREEGLDANVGWLLEGGRALLIIVLGVRILQLNFFNEIRILLGFSPAPGTVARALPKYIARVAYVVVAFCGVLALARYHFHTAPAYLATLQLRSDTFVEHWRTYLYYFPYSFVLFILIDVSLLIIPLFGGFLDDDTLKKLERLLADKIAAEPKPESLLDQFFPIEFQLPHFRMLRRYIDLYAAIALITVLEHFVFSRTLTDSANLWTLIATGLIALNSVCIYRIYSAYDRGYQHMLDVATPSAEWIARYSPMAFVKSMLFHTSSGLILWIILIIPGEQLLKRLFN